MRDSIKALAEALEGIGDKNSALLVAALGRYAETVEQGGEGWLGGFFKAKPAAKAEPVETQTKGGDLVWPFPAPEVLKQPGAFISAAIGWAGPQYGKTGKKGEVEAARLYLRHLMKVVAPAMASTLQAKWKMADNNPALQRNLKIWWKSLAQVWKLLQAMLEDINAYEIG